MARWRAKVFVNSMVGEIPVEVDASSYNGAKQLITQIYNPQTIYNLNRIGESGSSNSSSDDGESSAAGAGALIVLFFLLWLFAQFTPFILMSIGGVLGGKAVQLCIGKSIDEICDAHDSRAASSIVIAALVLGGIGFYCGDKIKKDYFTEQPKPSQIKNYDKSN